MSNKKYIGISNLATFLNNLGSKFAALTHKHTLSDISDYVIDNELSANSDNPVSNNVLNEEFNIISQSFEILESAIDDKLDSSTASSTYETKEDAQVKYDELNDSVSQKIQIITWEEND